MKGLWCEIKRKQSKWVKGWPATLERINDVGDEYESK